MAKYTKEDIIRLVEEEDVKFIRLQFSDIFGMLKNVAVTASQIEKVVSNQIMIDGSSIEGFVRIDESDQYLHPDLDSFAIMPWRPMNGKVARLLCSVHNPDGTPFVGDPRNVLKRAVDAAAAEGYTFNVGPECEFFLFETDEKGRPTTVPQDEAGYFDLSPVDHGETVRRDVCLALEAMGFEIEASHHEVAQGQHEVDFKYADAMTTADRIETLKLTVKTYASRNGLHATFMPKPIYGINGSGMHINMSLFKDGKNAFYDESDPRGLSKTAYSFIAGLMLHVPGMAAVLNPLVNSYKRLVPGYEAPCYVAWSASNRSALIRIPSARGSATRVAEVLAVTSKDETLRHLVTQGDGAAFWPAKTWPRPDPSKVRLCHLGGVHFTRVLYALLPPESPERKESPLLAALVEYFRELEEAPSPDMV